METTQKILLNSSINKKESNENASLNVSFSGNYKLLPEDGISDALNSYEVYLDERKKSNKFRLVVNINPFCSNVLFNPFTEIVKNEGTGDEVTWINYNNKYNDRDNVIGKLESFEWTPYDAIRDTQLSNEACGFEYHCGIDIFNNHILRNKTFKAVNFNENNSRSPIGTLENAYKGNYSKVKVNNAANEHVYVDNNFNTIDDYMRDKDGWIVSEQFPKIVKKETVHSNLETIILPLHLYQNYDIDTFKDTIKEKLIDDNGWYGFSNPATLGVTVVGDGEHQSSSTDYNFKVSPLTIDCEGEVNVTASSTTTTEDIDSSRLDINKVINSKEYCDFIDMYPGRDLYSFTPKYNSHRKRLEKNWNYCLTYPSESVVKNENIDFPFFKIDDSGNTSLKVYMFDEGTIDDDGRELVTIYTICQHGLMEGDTINIYKSDTIFYDSVEVVHIVDKYIFQIYKSNGNMSDYWIEVTNRYANNIAIENPFKLLKNDGTEILPSQQKILGGVFKAGENYYPICESNRCNVDPDAQDIHIRRVVNGVECKYYVRKFSRLPNFKFKDEEINDFTLYDDDQRKNHKQKRRIYDDTQLSLIDRFSKPGDSSCEFESHVAKLGFANTSYGDDTTEIVFTDDIDISYLRDNLGRPLSDLFITIVKNNKGYKEWYGIGKGIELNSIKVEYSHCFGKINSSFLLSDYYREFYQNTGNNVLLYDVRDITSNSFHSLLISDKVNTDTNPDSDEIEFDKDWKYYGDICCFSPVDCNEQSIQYAMHRFNTVQRELEVLKDKATEVYENYFNSGTLYYDEIFDVENTLPFLKSNNGDPYDKFRDGTLINRRKRSDLDSTSPYLYHSTKEEYKNMLNFKEGYYYQPHYKVPVKVVSKELNSDKAIEYEILEISNFNASTENNRKIYEIKTAVDNCFSENEKIVLYKKSINKYYFVTVYGIINVNRFTCTIADESGNHDIIIDGIFETKNINDYVLVKKHEDTPDYARLINDGSCRYVWRNVVSNGMESNEKQYPFTNGAFYINKQINFFLRRQDPKKINLGIIGTESIDFVPNGEDIRNYPNFNPVEEINYESNEIIEC